MAKAEVSKIGVLDMQVCVPDDWTDEAIVEFAQREYPCGTKAGWQIRRQGSELLAGSNERVPCRQRVGMVHVMLDA